MNSDQLRSMPLPCRLGWHRVDPLAQWNSGYYFATCERCGRDLVRTAFDGWRVPSGYRVVWQAEPPAQRRSGLVTMPVPTPDPVREPEYASDRPFEFPFTHAPRAEAHPRDDEQPAVAEAPAGEIEREPDVSSDRAPFADADDLRVLMTEDAPRSFAEPNTTAGRHRTAAKSLIPDWWDEPVRVATPFDAEIAAKASIEARLDLVEPAAFEPAGSEQDIPAPRAAEPDEVEPSSSEPGISGPVDAPHAPLRIDAGRPEPRYPIIPDFMDEDAAATAWDGSPVPIPVHTIASPSVSERARRNWHVMRGSLQRRVQTMRIPARRMADTMSAYRARRGGRTMASETEPSATTDLFARQAAVTFFALLAGVALVAAILDRRVGDVEASSAVPQASIPSTTPLVPRSTNSFPTGAMSVAGEAAPDQGFVTASLLNCRATPADNGNTVRKLARDAPVRVLGAEPGWLSISHRGRQCWTSSRFISTVQPL